MNRIFITGCGGSGTTVLRRLFNAFDNVEIIDGQITIDNYLKRNTKKKFLIGKRMGKTIYSGGLSNSEAKNQIPKIKNIGILNIIRDGRDIMYKRPWKMTPSRWIRSMEQWEKWPQYINLNIKYEDLVINPDKIQNNIANVFNLSIIHKFSDFPSFMPEWDGINEGKKIHELRKLDTNSIGKNYNYYKKVCSKKEKERFDYFLNKLGYL